MSDDFSVKSFSDLAYRVVEVDLQKRMFTATLVPLPRSSPSLYIAVLTAGGKVSSTPSDDRTNKIEFSFNAQTAWYIGSRFAEPTDLAVGQLIKANFIRKFFAGPPLITRCHEVWLDVESQDLATSRQLRSVTAYLRDRGFPLRVDSIDDANKLLKPTLLESGLHQISKEWKVGQTHDLSASTTLLRMGEPNGGQSVPDRMSGVTLKSIEELPIGYGCGGESLTFSVPMLYEAYRPGTILKLYPQGHAVPILPIEERMPKEFDTFLRP